MSAIKATAPDPELVLLVDPAARLLRDGEDFDTVARVGRRGGRFLGPVRFLKKTCTG